AHALRGTRPAPRTLASPHPPRARAPVRARADARWRRGARDGFRALGEQELRPACGRVSDGTRRDAHRTRRADDFRFVLPQPAHDAFEAGGRRRHATTRARGARGRARVARVRICLVYDHLYPQTIGGAERWLRDLAVHLVAGGHDVTYLTMRHWQPGAEPSLPGVRLLGLVAAGDVYADPRRTIGPPVRFGLAVARHLLRRGRDYDVVHAGSFPYFPLLGAALARRRGRYELEIEWYEVWTRTYWRRYAGTVVGTAGWLVQRACVRMPH